MSQVWLAWPPRGVDASRVHTASIGTQRENLSVKGSKDPETPKSKTKTVYTDYRKGSLVAHVVIRASILSQFLGVQGKEHKSSQKRKSVRELDWLRESSKLIDVIFRTRPKHKKSIVRRGRKVASEVNTSATGELVAQNPDNGKGLISAPITQADKEGRANPESMKYIGSI